MIARLLSALTVVLLCSTSACRSSDEVLVVVKPSDQTGGAPLEDVYVIAGTDKVWWPELRQGEVKSYPLRVELPAEVTVQFRELGRDVSWVGPLLDARQVSQIDLVLELGAAGAPVRYTLTPR